MKKNIFMRLACVVLVLTLLSTCVISGTFAKYVTTDSASDSARVAKFGVTVTADGTLFDNTYLKGATNTPGGDTTETSDTTVLSVESDTNVVAPGTKNDEGITFSITGTPEVDVKLDVAVTADEDDVFLKEGWYDDVTTGDADKVQVATKYQPVKYTLVNTTTSTTLVDGKDLAALSAALEGLTAAHIDAGTNLGTTYGTYRLTWAWAYGVDDGNITANDKADTILGDLAADDTSVQKYDDDADTTGENLVNETDYNLNTGLNIAITVTQID